MELKVGDWVILAIRGHIKGKESMDYSSHLELGKAYKVDESYEARIGGGSEPCICVEGDESNLTMLAEKFRLAHSHEIPGNNVNIENYSIWN